MKFLKTEEHFNMPICTVLLITYNHAEYIRKAIDSVLEQKTQYDFVIHIFDDASNDGTSDIIREYAQNYPDKIRPFISETNKGAQNNIWNAYKSVKTKYCALLECDDYWCDENKLELQITALEQHPECSFCAHDTVLYTLDESCREYCDGAIWMQQPLIKGKQIIKLEDIYPITNCGYIPHISSRLVRTDLLDLEKIKYKESVLFDFNQFYYLLLKAPFYYIDKIMSAYQKTGKGVHSQKTPFEVLNQELPLICDFNKETNFVIAEKIFQEYRTQINHRLELYYSYSGKEPLFLNTVEQTTQKKSTLSKIWKLIYSNPMHYIKNRMKGVNK